MSMRKGDRVEFDQDGKKFYGIVTKGGANKISVRVDGGDRGVSGHCSLFRTSNAPLPADYAPPAKWRKGDRVETDFEGKVLAGTIVKGGSNKVQMIIDGTSDQAITGHASCFRTTTVEVEKDEPNIMDGYTVKGYKTMRGHGDSACFEADIYYGGQKLLSVYNSGHGGCSEYQGYKSEKDTNKFFDDTKAWATLFGAGDCFDIADTWVDWYVNERPIGITAKAMWEGFKAQMEEWSKKYPKKEELAELAKDVEIEAPPANVVALIADGQGKFMEEEQRIQAMGLAMQMLEEQPDLEIRSALKEAGAAKNIPYGEEMEAYVLWAEKAMGVNEMINAHLMCIQCGTEWDATIPCNPDVQHTCKECKAEGVAWEENVKALNQKSLF